MIGIRIPKSQRGSLTLGTIVHRDDKVVLMEPVPMMVEVPFRKEGDAIVLEYLRVHNGRLVFEFPVAQ